MINKHVDYPTFEDLLGEICTNIEVDRSCGEIVFTLSDEQKFKLFHWNECCETVSIHEIVGDMDDIIGSPILLAEEVTEDDYDNDDGIAGYTFYKLSTIKGSVTISFYGSSNGYYSIGVDFIRL